MTDEKTITVKDLMDYLRKFPKNAQIVINGVESCVYASSVVYEEDTNEVIIGSEYSVL